MIGRAAGCPKPCLYAFFDLTKWNRDQQPGRSRLPNLLLGKFSLWIDRDSHRFSGLRLLFSGWSGAHTGTGTCNVIMSEDEFVTATFDTTPPDFSLQPASASLSAQRGSQVTDVITIASLNGGSFGSAIQLSCLVSGPVPMPTCALSPTSVTPGASSVTSTLTISAPAAAAVLTPAGSGRLSKSLYDGPLNNLAKKLPGDDR